MATANRITVRVECPDFEGIRKAAAAEVRAELDAIGDPVELARRAGRIIGTTTAALDGLRPVRDAAALSLWAYQAPPALHRSLGQTPTTLAKLTREALGLGAAERVPPAGRERIAAARAAGVTPVPDALRALPELAARAAEQQARRKAAVPYRNAAARELVNRLGWERGRVEAVTGMSKVAVHRAVHADGTPSNRYDEETRRRAVVLVLDQGMTGTAAGEQLGIGPATVRYWVRVERRLREATAALRQRDPEIRCKAVSMVLDQGMTGAAAATELGIGAPTVRWWARTARRERAAGPRSQPSRSDLP